MIEFDRRIRETLVNIRRASGLTQTELASLIEMKQSYICKYEKGKRSLKVTEFVKIARALGKCPSDILDLAELQNQEREQ